MTAPISLPTLDATESLAARLAPSLKKGDVLALYGDLGAGKTSFARALIHAFGIKGDVPSPTFTLLQNYDAPQFPITHFDLYRLKSPFELDEIGWDEALNESLALVEWPERAANRLPKNHLALHFTNTKDERSCMVVPHGSMAMRDFL